MKTQLNLWTYTFDITKLNAMKKTGLTFKTLGKVENLQYLKNLVL